VRESVIKREIVQSCFGAGVLTQNDSIKREPGHRRHRKQAYSNLARNRTWSDPIVYRLQGGHSRQCHVV